MMESALSPAAVSDSVQRMMESALSPAAVSDSVQRMMESALSSASKSESVQRMMESALSPAAVTESMQRMVESALTPASKSESVQRMMESVLGPAEVSESAKRILDLALADLGEPKEQAAVTPRDPADEPGSDALSATAVGTPSGAAWTNVDALVLAVLILSAWLAVHVTSEIARAATVAAAEAASSGLLLIGAFGTLEEQSPTVHGANEALQWALALRVVGRSGRDS